VDLVGRVDGERKLYRQLKAELLALQKTLKP
jgi:hypothetical protein